MTCILIIIVAEQSTLLTCILIIVIVLQASEVHQVGAESRSQVINTELLEGEVGVDCFCVAVGEEVIANSAVTLGQYVLYWKRYVIFVYS